MLMYILCIYRRVVGLFKIATKILSRDEYLRNEIMLLLDELFVQNMKQKDGRGDRNEYISYVDSNGDNIELKQSITDSTPNTINENDTGIRLFDVLSNQIAFGLWKFLTANVASLPLLSLKQWQTVFDMIAAVAGKADFAAMKAFEVSHWNYMINV